MKIEFYTLTYNNVIIATSHSKKSLDSILDKLKQDPKQIKDLIKQKRIINETNIHTAISSIPTS